MIPRRIALILGIANCLLGGVIYILLRSKCIIFLSWLDAIGATPVVDRLRLYTYGCISNEFILFSLPDGLWLLSYILIMGYVWHMDIRRTALFVMPLAAFAIGCEILQRVGLVSGTFDWNDILAYCIAITIGFAILIILNKQTIK